MPNDQSANLSTDISYIDRAHPRLEAEYPGQTPRSKACLQATRGVGARILGFKRPNVETLALLEVDGQDLGMKSRVHPKYTTKHRVGNWPEYDPSWPIRSSAYAASR